MAAEPQKPAEEVATTTSETVVEKEQQADGVVAAAVTAAAVTAATTDKEAVADPPPAVADEAEKPAEVVADKVADETVVDESKVSQSVSFKEETNVVSELPDVQKKALDELKQLIQEALNKHEFTAPPPAPVKAPEPEVAVKEEKKPEEDEKKTEEVVEEKKDEAVVEEKKVDEEKGSTSEEPKVETAEPEKEEKKVEETVVEVVEKIAASTEEDGAKTVEAIQESIVSVPVTEGEQPVAEPVAEVEVTPIVPEEVEIWGIPLLADERSDVILLKFLRARDFKVKEAFTMIKQTVLWRKVFEILLI